MKSGITIRFFPDWGRKEPLWSHDTDDCAVRTSDLPITAALAEDLHQYMEFWKEHFDPFADPGWDREEDRSWFVDEGSRLIRELASELEGNATISDERGEDAL